MATPQDQPQRPPMNSSISCMNPALPSRSGPPPQQQQQQQRPQTAHAHGGANLSRPQSLTPSPSPSPSPASPRGNMQPAPQPHRPAGSSAAAVPSGSSAASSTANSNGAQTARPASGGAPNRPPSSGEIRMTSTQPLTLNTGLAQAHSRQPSGPLSGGGSGTPPIQRRQSEILSPTHAQKLQQYQAQQAQSRQPRGSFSTSASASSATTYGPPRSGSFSSTVGGNGAAFPHWGTQLFPPPAPAASADSRPHGLASLYHHHKSSTATAVPFAPPPSPAQNLCDDPDFFERYKAVWAGGFHPIHDGIERPAVHALLPARVYWYSKRMLDIGCGSGKLCRMFRAANARAVVGIDCSAKMISVARAREAQEEVASLSGGGGGAGSKGVGSMLKKLFSVGDGSGGSGGGGGADDTLTEQDKGKLLAKRHLARLKAEDEARENIEAAKALAAATAEAEKERERIAREKEGGHGGGGGSSFSLSKLFRKEVKQLKPSSEAASYIAEADAKRQQREHEERVAAAAAAAAAGHNASSSSSSSSLPKRRASEDLSSSSSSSSLDEGALSDSGTSRHVAIGPPIQFIHTSFEEWDASEVTPFDLITCTMVLQFVWDLKAFAHKVSSLLVPNGLLILSLDHPVSTSSWGLHPIVVKSERNPLDIQYFPLDAYGVEGERTAKYYTEGVRKFHRTIETYLTTFLAAGLVLERLTEPRASAEMEQAHPELKTWRRKPIFLCMRFRKPRNDDF